MEHDRLFVEARAKIIWGDSASSARVFLIDNGVPEAEASAKVSEFVLERDSEIKKLGVRNTITGLILTGAAGGTLVWIFTWILPPDTARVYAFGGRGIGTGVIALIAIAIYGFWKLVKGISWLVRPKSEHRSIPDISE